MEEMLDQMPAEAVQEETVLPMSEDRAWLAKVRSIHQKYMAGLAPMYERIKSNEEWWRLHNDSEEKKDTEIGRDGGYVAKSSWLANVVISKQADGMDAYPEGSFLPREQADEETAKALSKIVPCVLELVGFPKVWGKLQWRKPRHGAGVYKVTWEPSAYNGLGEISLCCVNPLNLAWQPACTSIQDSPFFFHQEYVDRETLCARYPKAKENLTAAEKIPEFYHDEQSRDMTDVATVVEVYYKVARPGVIPGTSRMVLHYAIYTGDVLLYTSEDDERYQDKGWYHHGLYPYHIDVLFPDEDSAFGHGYIDLGKSPQTQIDILNTAFLKNSVAGSLPRWLASNGAKINAEDLLDTSKPIIPVDGTVDERVLRQVDHKPLDGNYLNLRDSLIQELRETTSNNEAATGSGTSGATAASAIAALQEASGKVSRAANANSYWVFADVLRMIVELIRQFYTAPRTFRITGADGGYEFVTFDNRVLQNQSVDAAGGGTTLRRPEFDVIVGAQKASPYSRMAQNELMLQFWGAGFFDPARAEQATLCLEGMDFPGKEELLGKIRDNAKTHAMMLQFAQLAMAYAPPEQQEAIAQAVMQTSGQTVAPVTAAPVASTNGGEAAHMRAARERAQERAVPAGG